MILLEFQNINIFFQNVTHQIGLKEFLWLKKIKEILWLKKSKTYVISDLKDEEIVRTSDEKQ